MNPTSSSPLESEIVRLIRAAGPMPVWRYMELCLSHPQHGYYIDRDPLGRGGDFITAPEVSQMFGELLGLWAASVWKTMGSPQLVRLVELGPGRGTLMMDALRAMRVVAGLGEACHVHLVEINSVLREKQRENLKNVANLSWHDRFDDVPEGPAIIFANEFFDVLPVHQMVRQPGGWHERVVEIGADGKLVFGISRDPVPHFEALLPPLVRVAPVGAIFEWRQPSFAMTLARRLRDQGGAALVIDYGHLRSEPGETLQAVANHGYADPLRNPGLCDITAHVDFQALALAAEDAGGRIHGPVEQGTFLGRLGIETRAVTLMSKASPEMSEEIASGLQRLTHPGKGAMGSLFKVMGISDPAITELTGLSEPQSATEPSIVARSPVE